MSVAKSEQDKTYAYADYLNWNDKERVELIDGTPYLMSPAPSRLHQELVFELNRQFGNALKGKKCKGYTAPFDVRLSEIKDANDSEVHTVVQPDLVIVCDLAKLDDKGCNGAPDLVIEVISPSTASHDYIRKMNVYEKHGVKEYWIVHPHDKIVMVYQLENGEYQRPKIYDNEATVQVGILPEIEIDLTELFPNGETEMN